MPPARRIPAWTKPATALLLALAVEAPSISSASAPQLLLIDTELKNVAIWNAFDVDPAKGKPKPGGLAELKWKELRKQWSECRDLAAKLGPKHKSLEFWIWRTRLECALRAHETKKQTKALEATFAAFPLEGLRAGPWQESLSALWIRAGRTLVEAAKGAPVASLRSHVNELLRRPDLVGRGDQAWLFARLAEALFKAGDAEQAAFFFRQAADLSKDPGFLTKYEELSGFKLPPKAQPPVEPLIGAEAETWAEIEDLLKKKSDLDAARLMVLLLRRFPAGKSAAQASERLMKMAQELFDRNDPEATKAFAAVLKEADPSRQLEWAGLAHRRTDDLLCLELSESALEALASSTSATKLLWMAGRSAHFLGEYERAIRHFDQLVQFHAATEEAGEALFRMSLIQLRTGNHATAARLLQRLLDQNIERWDLNARYWRVRALQTADKEKATAARDELITKYPFTYYGLVLRAERDGGAVEFGKNDRSPLETRTAKLWLVGEQKLAWQRFRALVKEGWIIEAQAEVAAMPTPADPWSALQWAKLLAKAGQHLPAIQLVNRAQDEEPTLRHPRYLEAGFPKSYSRWIDIEGPRRQLSPVLVRSLIRQESAFTLRAVSTSNAMGLMQMIPPTAREIARDLNLSVEIPADMFRPEVNVPMGTYYIAKVIREFDGNVPLGLAGYNAGPHRIARWIEKRGETAALKGKTFDSWRDEIWYDELPWSETSFYVKAILRNILLDRVLSEGKVQVAQAFWTDLLLKPAETPVDGVGQR